MTDSPLFIAYPELAAVAVLVLAVIGFFTLVARYPAVMVTAAGAIAFLVSRGAS